MKVYELLIFNRELLKRFHAAGIKPEDYKYVDLYAEYQRRSSQGEKVTYIIALLADRYSISERQVYKLIDKFGKNVNYCKSCSVE